MAAVALANPPLPRKLRVGLFADSRLQPRWVVEAFDKVARSEFAEIVLVCAGEAQARDPLLWTLYGHLDRWAFGAEPSERVDLAKLQKPIRGQDTYPDPEFVLNSESGS